ncbi:hypothetical protein TNCV_2193381 [Trichonephila clavipes]|nr:hypothetical protein TNCV_2193381 [Trichonephila clavipes]
MVGSAKSLNMWRQNLKYEAVMNLPPNVTMLMQPMGQGVIENSRKFIVQEGSDPVDDETDEDETTTTKVARVHQMLKRFRISDSCGVVMSNNKSAVPLN